MHTGFWLRLIVSMARITAVGYTAPWRGRKTPLLEGVNSFSPVVCRGADFAIMSLEM
jgi:hypothetical protein